MGKVQNNDFRNFLRSHGFYLRNTIFFSAFSLWIFYLTFDTLAYLNPKEISWFGVDNTTGYIAQLFFVSDEWRFPILRNPTYGDALSTSPTFTGPSPLIVLLMKLLGLNPELQFFGFWIVLNIFLQLCFGFKLLRILDVSAKFSTLLSIFFVTPFLIFRIPAHFWLISHYLILWSLCILFTFLLEKQLRRWEIALLLGISYLTNVYLLAMVVLVLILLFINRLTSSKKHFREIFADFAYPFLTLFLVFFFFDSFDRQDNLYQSVKMYLSSTYGYHGFNLLTFVNPDTGTIAEGWTDTENLTNFSILPISLGMIPGSYEGFMYLGLGTILILSSIILFKSRFAAIKLFKFEPLQIKVSYLYALFIVLFAVSYRVGFGAWSFELPFPEYLDWLLGSFRASGRFMWPFAYALIGIVLAKFYKTLETKRINYFGTAAIVLVLLIQQVDLTVPLFRQDKELNLTTYENDFKTDDFAEASKSLKDFTSIRAYPQGDVLANHYAELNYLAWTLKSRTDLHFTSRMNMNAVYSREKQTFEDLCSGKLRHFVAYAVTNGREKDFSECTDKVKPIFKGEFHTFYGNQP